MADYSGGKLVKVLTITQPYATLITIGAKKIETRNWPTKYRGPLAIHAAKGITKYERFLFEDSPFREAFRAAGMTSADVDAQRGHIIAVAEIVACAEADNHAQVGEPEFSFGDYTPGRFMWLLKNVRRLDKPVLVKGALGLWNYEGELI
jgi:hypothetical protein